MGTFIESAAASHRRGRLHRGGALHLTDIAATACLRRANHSADELDILINTGIYKDFNTAEPALASIIQEDIGANVGSPVLRGHHGTFSFDVANGGCGVITAAQLVDAFVGHGAARLGMVVAGDSDPSPRTTLGFPFSAAGGAMLCGHVDDDSGFQRFDLRTFPEHATLFESRMRWDPHAGLLHRGRNVLDVFEAPDFAARCVDHASEVVDEMVREVGLVPDDISLVIASQYPLAFGEQLMRRLAIPGDRLQRVAPELVGAHTAGPIAALEAAIASRRFATSTYTLFITVGAGITVGAALYRTAASHPRC